MLWGCLGDTWGQYIYYNALKRLKMATIHSGFLMGLYKSASGMTFYKRRGTSAVRSKPVRSLSWVPSVRQTYFQVIFSAVNDFIKSETWLGALIAGGWGWSRRHNSSSNLNNIIGYIVRTITRREGGERRPIDEVNALGNEFILRPLKFFVERCQLTASKYPLVGEAQVLMSDGVQSTVQISYAECVAWYNKVCAMEGKFRSNPKFYFLVSTGGDGESLNPNIGIYAGEVADGVVKTQIETSVLKNTVFQVSLGINASTDEAYLDPNLWAFSPVIASARLVSSIPPYTPMTVTQVTVAGMVKPTSAPLQINTGQAVEIYGTALTPTEVLVQFYGPNGSSGNSFRLTSVMDVESILPEGLSGKWTDVYERKIESFQRIDGQVLISYPFS